MKNLFSAICTAIVALVLVQGCRPASEKPVVSDADALAEKALTVDSCFTKDTVFVLGGREIPFVKIERIYPTEHQDAYISMRVFALRDSSCVNGCLGRIVSENFGLVSGGDLSYRPGRRTPADVARQMDYYGDVFVDTILPQLKGAVEESGFFMNMDLRPAWADAEKGIITYSSYVESCGGGACDVDAYYVSFSRDCNSELTLARLVPDPDRRREVREALVDEIADDARLSTDALLRRVSDYIAPGAIEPLTAATFPVEHVALMGTSLVFSYPEGSIAPVAEGCPMYTIPLPKE